MIDEDEKESLENPCPTATPPWILQQQKKEEQEKSEKKEERDAAE